MRNEFLRFAKSFAAVVCLASAVICQSDSQRLNAKLVESFQRGDLDAAVPIAEEIVALERSSTPLSTRNLANALENLGQVKLDRVKRSMGELSDPNLGVEKAKGVIGLLRKDASEAENHLRESISLLGDAKSNPDQAINVRSRLAWLTYNYIPSDTSPTFGFDKDSREKIGSRERAVHYSRFEEARRLFTEARDIAARTDNVALLLGANFKLAEFELALGNFEAAGPLYETIIADAERMLPARSPELVAPYQAYLKVLGATGQEEKAFEVLSKIVAVTGRSAEYPKALMNLTLRADRSFVPVNSQRVEEESQKMKSRADLSGRSLVAQVAAAGGNVAEATLNNSVNGQVLFETAAGRGIRLVKIRVRVETDESGRTITSEALTTNKSLKETSEACVRDWTFHPVLIDGKPTKLKGYAEVSILTN